MAPSSGSAFEHRHRKSWPSSSAEGLHPAALGIHARHDVLDGPVLAGRVHGLEHDQERMSAVRPQQLLRCGELVDELSEILLGDLLALLVVAVLVLGTQPVGGHALSAAPVEPGEPTRLDPHLA